MGFWEFFGEVRIFVINKFEGQMLKVMEKWENVGFKGS